MKIAWGPPAKENEFNLEREAIALAKKDHQILLKSPSVLGGDWSAWIFHSSDTQKTAGWHSHAQTMEEAAQECLRKFRELDGD